MPLLSRSPFPRLRLYAAAGAFAAVAALAAAGPTHAAADPDRRPAETSPAYKGKIVAKSGLLLRDKPTRSSRIIGHKPYGAIVDIFCKTRGENVYGNDRWYLLTDGTWAWGPARYIANVGPAPRWC